MPKKVESLGEIIKKARKEKKLSARKLAELCDVSHTEINNIEKGIRIKPAVLTLKCFEKYLDLDYARLCRLAGYSEETIKYGDESIIISYEKYDQIIQNYRREMNHCAYLIETKRRYGQEIKESFDVVCKYIDTLDNVPENVKKEIRLIYRDLEKIDYKYVRLMQEK